MARHPHPSPLQALVALLLVTPLLGATPMEDNAEYLGWAGFQPGSSATYRITDYDIERSGAPGQNQVLNVSQFTGELTMRLVSINSKKAVVEWCLTAVVDGKRHETGREQREVPAKVRAISHSVAPAGRQKIRAAGSTYLCNVAMTTNKAAPKSKRPFMKIWSSDRVPGGVVKAEVAAPGNDAPFFNMTLAKTRVVR